MATDISMEEARSLKKKCGMMSGFVSEIRQNRSMYLMALPGIAFFFIFNYLPIGGIVIAFKNYNFKDGIFGSPWNGFDNFRFFFESPDCLKLIRNTIMLSALFTITGMIFQVGMALLFNEVFFQTFKKITQSIMIFPNFISFIVVAVILQNLFSTRLGILNSLLVSLGRQPVNWYMDSDLWVLIITVVLIWKSTGFGMIIFLAAITSIDVELYEAAIIDGAGRFQQAFRITLPSIKSIIVFLLLLSIGRIFSTDAGMIWALIGDNSMLYEYMDTVDTFVFRNLRNNPDIGMSAAVGLFQAFVGYILIMVSNGVARKYSPEGAIV